MIKGQYEDLKIKTWQTLQKFQEQLKSITCLRDICVMHAIHSSPNCCKKENKSCIMKQFVLIKKTAQIITKQTLFNLLHMPWSIKLSPACTMQSIMDEMSSNFRKQNKALLPRLHASWMLFNMKPTTVIRQSYLGHIFKRDPLEACF
jgi:hypothetical protein